MRDAAVRYDLYTNLHGGYMDPAVQGEWVRFEDYDRLRQQLISREDRENALQLAAQAAHKGDGVIIADLEGHHSEHWMYDEARQAVQYARAARTLLKLDTGQEG